MKNLIHQYMIQQIQELGQQEPIYNKIDSGQMLPKKSPQVLLVLEQKVINKQVAYLILKGTKKHWVKLCQANDSETKAILQYQSDKNVGVEPIYHPEADMYGEGGRLQQEVGNVPIGQIKYNLRERELLPISKHQFYGLKPKQQKQQPTSHILQKSQIKHQSHKKSIKFQQTKPITSQNNKIQGSMYIKKQTKKIKIINVQRRMIKRKIIKKSTNMSITEAKRQKQNETKNQMKDKYNYIEIFDGNDSQLEMM